MAKFSGMIGFATNVETAPGVWEEVINEIPYRGDILRTSRRAQSTTELNDDIVVTNRISIISNPYATANFFRIRYVKWQGVLWKVTDVTVKYPRLILSLGGVYNG